MLRPAIGGAESDEFGLLRAFERHARARHDGERLRGLVFVVANVLRVHDKHILLRARHACADDGRKQAREFRQFDRGGKSSRQRLALGVERPLHRIGKIGGRIRDGAQLLRRRILADGERHDIGGVETDLQCARAGMRQHQAQILHRFAGARKLRAAQGLHGIGDHDFATVLHHDGLARAQGMGGAFHRPRLQAQGGLAALARGGFAFTPSQLWSWRCGHDPHIHRHGKTG